MTVPGTQKHAIAISLLLYVIRARKKELVEFGEVSYLKVT